MKKSRITQSKARNAEMVRSETLTFRLDARLKFLADLAARSQGRKLSNYVEQALEQSFASVLIVDEREATPGDSPNYQQPHGKSLADVADELWDNDEATRFLNVVGLAPFLVTDGESKLLQIIQHSDYYSPRGLRNGQRVAEDWEMLKAIVTGEAEVDILPPDRRPSKALSFGLLGDQERIALYKSDNAAFQKRSTAYLKAMKVRMYGD
jgi:hypothetical protein